MGEGGGPDGCSRVPDTEDEGLIIDGNGNEERGHLCNFYVNYLDMSDYTLFLWTNVYCLGAIQGSR